MVDMVTVVTVSHTKIFEEAIHFCVTILLN